MLGKNTSRRNFWRIAVNIRRFINSGWKIISIFSFCLHIWWPEWPSLLSEVCRWEKIALFSGCWAHYEFPKTSLSGIVFSVNLKIKRRWKFFLWKVNIISYSLRRHVPIPSQCPFSKFDLFVESGDGASLSAYSGLWVIFIRRDSYFECTVDLWWSGILLLGVYYQEKKLWLCV